MKYRFLLFSLLGVLVSESVFAAHHFDRYVKTVSSSIRNSWMTPSNGSRAVGEKVYGDTGGAGDFILAGALGTSGGRGTYGDEYAIVSVVAKQIVPHGGYFCPQQIQCGNKNCYFSSWAKYFNPDGYSEDKCAWFCEAGYAGTNCNKIATTVGMDTLTNESGLFSGLGLKQSGGDDDSTEKSIYVFSTFYADNGERTDIDGTDVLLGVVEFKDHGVVAGPVAVQCHSNTSCGNHSYVWGVSQYSNLDYKLLCAEGYIPDSSGTDCVKLTQDTLNLYTAGVGYEMCTGWSESGYDSDIHSIDTSSGCVKFMCKDATKAFPAVGNFECVDCAASIRGGQDPKTGLCVQCSQVGQYFDTGTSTCRTALGFSKTDMQYGKGKTKNNNPEPANQCWTKTETDVYRTCVTGKTTETSN